MNYSLKPSTFLSEFMPGLYFILFALFAYYKFDLTVIKTNLMGTEYNGALVVVVMFAFAFFIGEIFDAIRNGFIEDWWDDRMKMYWEFFHERSEEEIRKLRENYFNHYTYDVNTISSLSLCVLVIVIRIIICPCHYSYFVILAGILIAVWSLYKDAHSLRTEMTRITNETPKL